MAKKKRKGVFARDIDKLNMWFAIVAIASFLSVMWMIGDDYARPWKKYQRQFQVIQHDLERVEAKLVTARTLSGDWFYPMDLATINEDRYVFLKRRADDIISTDGIKFYPIEVENVLMSHPDVTAAAVFDWPHPRYGQVPVAAITNSAPITHNDRVAYYGRQIAPYKIPGSFMFLPEMPRNSMGKILKSRLKEMLKQELAKQS